MAQRLSWLKASGRHIVDESGQPILLKGYCLGGWLNTENFINGYPFCDHLYFRALCKAIGEDKARYYYERQYEHYLGEEDIALLAECGTNSVRVPFNYRLFESDSRPGHYDGPGWQYFDRLVRWCAKHRMYIILDLHAAQGWQNTDWHCDNPADVVLLWTTKDYQDRVVDLWRAIASRYKNEPTIAGYELFNEPVCPSGQMLQAFYEDAVAKIRRVDKKHIIFLEGNMWGSNFDGMKPLSDPNIVYTCHIYPAAAFEMKVYPHEGQNPQTFERDYKNRADFGRRHRVPMWCGEFGVQAHVGNAAVRRGRLAALDDMITHFESLGHSWAQWTYKDVGVMGLTTLDPKSPYMRRTRPVRRLKAVLGTDLWTDAPRVHAQEWFKQAVQSVMKAAGRRLEERAVQRALRRHYMDACAKLLMGPFAEQFRGMSKPQIDAMMKSWRLENCRLHQGLVNVLRKHRA